MNKTELATALAERVSVSNDDALKMLNAFTDIVAEQLSEGGDVTIIGFGAFRVQSRPERQGRNPRTGEPIIIPARNTPSFRAGKGLRDAVNHK